MKFAKVLTLFIRNAWILVKRDLTIYRHWKLLVVVHCPLSTVHCPLFTGLFFGLCRYFVGLGSWKSMKKHFSSTLSIVQVRSSNLNIYILPTLILLRLSEDIGESGGVCCVKVKYVEVVRFLRLI